MIYCFGGHERGNGQGVAREARFSIVPEPVMFVVDGFSSIPQFDIAPY